MAKITIKELYYGDKYAVMGEVFKTMFLAFPNKASVDEQTALELEFVRQTLIAVEKMKKNGDCIAEGELGDAVTVSVSEPVPIDIKDKDFGALLICAVRYCIGRQTYMPGLIIGYINDFKHLQPYHRHDATAGGGEDRPRDRRYKRRNARTAASQGK